MVDTKADIQAWDQNADTYAAMIGTADDRMYALFREVLWESLGDLRGLDVLDLGCGHGWLSTAMAEAGASIWGIDGSIELLKMAQNVCPDGEFLTYDLSLGLPPFAQKFDRIVSYMVLMDIPELDALLKSVRDVLQENGGKFIFTMTHPCFFNQKATYDAENDQYFCKVTGYLKSDVWWIENFGGHRHYHRSLTDYFELLRANRLAVTRFYEPPQALPASAPEDDFRYEIPKFVLFEAIPI